MPGEQPLAEDAGAALKRSTAPSRRRTDAPTPRPRRVFAVAATACEDATVDASLLDSTVVAAAVGTIACGLGNLRAARAALLAPRLDEQPPELPGAPATEVPGAAPGDRRWPTLSVVVAACNEATTLGPAARSLLAADYPDLELVLVDDRSTDGTGALVDALAAGDARVRALHVTELPEGWLGKVHALHLGTQAARGELLLFADADVVFAPGALRRAVAWMERERLDHLSLLPRMIGPTPWVGAASSAFATGFLLGVNVEAIGRPGSRAAAGIGAFNLVRRAALDRTPGWPWLRMEVAEDTGLAMMIVREGGGRSRLGSGAGLLELEWYPSLGALVAGLEKNLYGILGRYSPARALGFLVGMVWLAASGWVAIGLGVALGRPWLLGLAAFAWATQAVVALAYRRAMAQPAGATMLAPFMLFALLYALARSTLVTWRRGGITWRGTFYPVGLLRAGRRIDL